MGASLGAVARHGYDKLTLLTSPGLASFGLWLEQLVAESTGKLGRGVVPVDGEPWGPSPSDYSPDRVFVALSLKDEGEPATRFADSLAAAGHPFLRWELDSRESLGGQFFRWEVAPAILGSLLEVEPLDEPVA